MTFEDVNIDVHIYTGYIKYNFNIHTFYDMFETLQWSLESTEIFVRSLLG